MLLWLSTVWGLAVSNKILDPVLHRAFTYDFHQFLSLLAIGFIFLHIVRVAGRSVSAVLGGADSGAVRRAVSTGVGGHRHDRVVSDPVGLDHVLHPASWIGQKTFRVIHLVSYLAFIAAALHGLFAGTDSPLPTVQVMYLVTTLSVVFLTVYRIVMSKRLRRQAYRSLAHDLSPSRVDWLTASLDVCSEPVVVSGCLIAVTVVSWRRC